MELCRLSQSGPQKREPGEEDGREGALKCCRISRLGIGEIQRVVQPRVHAAGFALSCTLLCGLGVPTWVVPQEKTALGGALRESRVAAPHAGWRGLNARGYGPLLAFGVHY